MQTLNKNLYYVVTQNKKIHAMKEKKNKTETASTQMYKKYC